MRQKNYILLTNEVEELFLAITGGELVDKLDSGLKDGFENCDYDWRDDEEDEEYNEELSTLKTTNTDRAEYCGNDINYDDYYSGEIWRLG